MIVRLLYPQDSPHRISRENYERRDCLPVFRRENYLTAGKLAGRLSTYKSYMLTAFHEK